MFQLKLLVADAAVLQIVGRRRCLFVLRGVAVVHWMLRRRCLVLGLLQQFVVVDLLTTTLARMRRLARYDAVAVVRTCFLLCLLLILKTLLVVFLLGYSACRLHGCLLLQLFVRLGIDGLCLMQLSVYLFLALLILFLRQ